MVWGYGNTTVHTIVLQKKSIKIFYSLPYYDRTSMQFQRKRKQPLKLFDLFKYHILIFLYRCSTLGEDGCNMNL